MFWFLQRIAISLALLWVVTSLVFLSIYMVPGDPAELLLSGEGSTPDAASVAQLRNDLEPRPADTDAICRSDVRPHSL